MTDVKAVKNRILRECENARLEQHLRLIGDEEWKLLAEAIDESAFSVLEWVHSLLFFQEWQEKTARKLSLTDQIAYIACCAQGAVQTGNLVPLPDLVEDFVRNFGVENARD